MRLLLPRHPELVAHKYGRSHDLPLGTSPLQKFFHIPHSRLFFTMMTGKILTLDEVSSCRAILRREGRRVVVANGCFDLLHVGHLRYLTEARAFGDFLWVGLNGDASVRDLKGPGRPIVPEADRAELLAAWRVVDAVTIFPEVRATSFLRVVQPDVYVKGGDYTAESVDPGEGAALRECGARVEIVRLVPGKSTTSLGQKMTGK